MSYLGKAFQETDIHTMKMLATCDPWGKEGSENKKAITSPGQVTWDKWLQSEPRTDIRDRDRLAWWLEAWTMSQTWGSNLSSATTTELCDPG